MSTQDQCVLDVEHLAETIDLECKAAQGQDGQGELPHDFWKTYSAMANPFGGTYLRLHEGDYPADRERVQRMIAENTSAPRDDHILPGMDIELLDAEAVARYQRAFGLYKPGHIWAGLPTKDFLTKIGAYGRNWHEGTQGLRLAGLLMFGRAEIIRDVLPYYMLDYQEHLSLDENERWSDRLIPDGTWSGNLYDFFSRVYRKLITDLKVPFRLEGAQRVDDTPAHEALREALVNTLIHADFHAPAPILVIKRADSFSFRNPGRMRVPIESALHGGLSDCRNRRLQTMFQLVGFGDLAGSGVPKIFTRWASQHWVHPLLQEDPEHELTTLELRMIDQVPSETTGVDEQNHRSKLSKPPEYTSEPTGVAQTLHPKGAKFPPEALETTGVEQTLPPSGANFAPEHLHKTTEPGQSSRLESAKFAPEGDGGAPSTSLPFPLYLDWDKMPARLQTQLQTLAHPVSSRKWASQALLQDTILNLCDGRFLGPQVLAHLLDREHKELRKRTLNPMVEAGLLRPAHASISARQQAYTRATPSSQSLT
ncbi:MAG: hypothetical protein Q4D91_04155 [Lautropia sp.]|nr:hypothetical protein [Lautropia sp.]